MRPVKDFQQLQYLASMESALKVAQSWLDVKPNNKELQTLVSSLIDINVYLSSLELERRSFDTIVTDLRLSKNRAVVRARNSEENKAPTKPDLTHLIAP